MTIQIQIQLILTACIVNFGFSPAESRSQISKRAISNNVNYDGEIRENFQHLFDSIASNDAKKSESYRDILKEEVQNERKAFDIMKDELWFARSKRSSRKRNSYGKNNDDRMVAVKREANENNRSTQDAVFGQNTTSEELDQSASITKKFDEYTHEEEDAENQTTEDVPNPIFTNKKDIVNQTSSGQDSVQSSNETTNVNESTTEALHPPEGALEKTLSPQKLIEWMKITPGFYAEPMCVLKRGIFLRNVKLSPKDLYLNAWRCTIQYCTMEATIKSYTCAFLNSTLEQHLKVDVKIDEALAECAKWRCLTR